MGTIAFTRNSGGVTISQSGRNPYTNADPTAVVEILAGSACWITMAADQAQFTCVLADTITINGAAFSGTLAQLQTKLRDQVFYESRTRSELAMAITMMGGSMLGESVGMTLKQPLTAQPLTAQGMRIEPVVANFTGAATGVRVNIATQGSYTANNFNGAALFDINSSGACNRAAISADMPTVWTGAVGYVDLPFTAPINVAADQLYVIAFLWNASATTTAPALRGSNLGTTATAGYPMANSCKLTGIMNAQSAIPTSFNMSAVSVSSTAYWCCLY